MADVATLGLEIDSAPVEKGAKSLDRLTNAAGRAEAAADGMSSSYANAGKRVVSAADAAEAALNGQANAANRAAAAMRAAGAAANDNTYRAGAHNVANIAAQFQDVAVSAAMGMSALQVGLQQGTQLAAAGLSVQALGQALVSVLSPASLLTIAIVSLVAAGIQMVDWAKVGAAALRGLASVLPTIAPYAAGAAAALALLYAPTILSGISAVTMGILRLAASAATLTAAFALANPFTAIVAGAAIALTAAYAFRDDLAKILGVDIYSYAKTGANLVIGAFVAAFQDIKFVWSNFPALIGNSVIGASNAVISTVEGMINRAIGLINQLVDNANSALAKLPGGVQLGRLGNVSMGQVANPLAGQIEGAIAGRNAAIQSAMSTDYLGGIGSSIATGAAAGVTKLKELAAELTKVDEKDKKGGKTAAEKYADVIGWADRRIASLQAEQASLGLTEEAAARLRYEQDLLNQADRADITLSAQQRAELAGKAAEMARVETTTRKAKEAMDLAKDATSGFLSDLRQGLVNGEGLWQSFGNAALNVLDKIVSKVEDELVDALFSAGGVGSSGGGIGGIFGGLFKMFGLGFASGGYTGRGPASRAAGVVHGGEYVFSKRATDRIGVGNLEAMHRSAKGYASGGYVAPVSRAPMFQRMAGASASAPGPISVSIDLKGANGDKTIAQIAQAATAQGVQQALAAYDKRLLPNIQTQSRRLDTR
ncbi:phage tail tape-measure protein [Ancylobacter sp. VNQ12]|uniref:phage tail tape-measure protein n=1 Tax=Ancylobacter sp. VNQ12 TaxID=3400920 RepID=UPI003C030F4F